MGLYRLFWAILFNEIFEKIGVALTIQGKRYLAVLIPRIGHGICQFQSHTSLNAIAIGTAM